jgi:hypothetical protein
MRYPKWLVYTANAIAGLIFGLLIGMFLLLGFGCESSLPSPIHPERKVSVDQYRIETDQLAAEKEREARKASQRFTIAVKKLQASSEIDLAELTAAHDESVEKYEAQAKEIREAGKATIEAMEARNAAWTNGLGMVATIAQGSGFPPAIAIGGLLTTALAGYKAVSNGRRAAKAETEVQHASRAIDSIDILKQMVPEVAKAFKDNAAIIAQWQGVGGTQFVNKVQNS